MTPNTAYADKLLHPILYACTHTYTHECTHTHTHTKVCTHSGFHSSPFFSRCLREALCFSSSLCFSSAASSIWTPQHTQWYNSNTDRHTDTHQRQDTDRQADQRHRQIDRQTFPPSSSLWSGLFLESVGHLTPTKLHSTSQCMMTHT